MVGNLFGSLRSRGHRQGAPLESVTECFRRFKLMHESQAQLKLHFRGGWQPSLIKGQQARPVIVEREYKNKQKACA